MPGKVFRMNQNTTNTETADTIPELVVSRSKIHSKATNQKPQTLTEARAERIRQVAAQRCPEEYRAAYAHLLETLWKTTDTIREECELSEAEEIEFKCRYNILYLLLREPQIDPYDLGDMADDLAPVFPNLRQFAERVKVLADLQGD